MAAPDLEALLELQAVDTELDQLRHRRANLEERALLAARRSELQAVEQQLADAGAAAGELESRQAEIEAELAATESRAAELDKRFYSGSVTASRDLMAITEEIDSLKARRSHLEDRILEVMTEREPVDAVVSDLEAKRAELAAAADSIASALASSEAEVDTAIAAVEARREAARSEVPDTLAARYETLRAKLGGVGAARLVGSSCSGCHLTLPASEVERVRRAAEGTVLECDQCGRILVP